MTIQWAETSFSAPELNGKRVAIFVGDYALIDWCPCGHVCLNGIRACCLCRDTRLGSDVLESAQAIGGTRLPVCAICQERRR